MRTLGTPLTVLAATFVLQAPSRRRRRDHGGGEIGQQREGPADFRSVFAPDVGARTAARMASAHR